MQFFGLAVVGIVFPLALCGLESLPPAPAAPADPPARSPGSPARCCLRPRSPACRCSRNGRCRPASAARRRPRRSASPEWFGGGDAFGRPLCRALRRPRRAFARPPLGRPACRARSTVAVARAVQAAQSARSRTTRTRMTEESASASRLQPARRHPRALGADAPRAGRAPARRAAPSAPRMRAASRSRDAAAASRSSMSDDEARFGEDPEFDDAFAEAIEEELPARTVRPKAVVQPPAPRPKQSARVKKEAQPSLLPSARFRAAAAASPLRAAEAARRKDTRSTRARSSRTPGCSKACSTISACAARSSTSAPARS